MRFIVQVIINAIALWAISALLAGVAIVPQNKGFANDAIVVLAVGFVLALVNAIVKPIVKVLAFPLYLLTLGLFGLVVNALMLLLTSWLTSMTSFGLEIAGFWTAVWAGLWLSICTVILGAIFGQNKR